MEVTGSDCSREQAFIIPVPNITEHWVRGWGGGEDVKRAAPCPFALLNICSVLYAN